MMMTSNVNKNVVTFLVTRPLPTNEIGWTSPDLETTFDIFNGQFDLGLRFTNLYFDILLPLEIANLNIGESYR